MIKLTQLPNHWLQSTLLLVGGLFALGVIPATAVAQTNGVIQVDVDATNMARHLLKSQLTIPIESGRQSLWFPKWIPGIHGPGAQVGNVAGLTITSPDGKPISWHRDPDNVYRFLVDVPEGVEAIHVGLVYIANQPTTNSIGVDAFGNADVLIINFNTCIVYPDNAAADELPVALRVRLPADWKFGTALREKQSDSDFNSNSNSDADWVSFETESLYTVIDSPLIAGHNYRLLEMETPDFPDTRMHFVSESAEALEFDDEQANRYHRLVTETAALFGGAPFKEYDFLVVCSDDLPNMGLEHHASSLNGIPEEGLTDEDELKGWSAYLLSHEIAHAWCGKYRRPQGMTRQVYHTTKDTELLWIYEGLTQYLGHILAVRAGLVAFEEHLDRTAGRVGYLSLRQGRQWRSLADTAVANYTLRASSQSWNDLRRGQDYYDEGALFWLEVDCLLRDRSGGKVSLDDFCQRFFHSGPNDPQVKSYDLDEVVAALNNLVPHDWLGLIRRRVYQPLDQMELASLWSAGYEYTFADERPEHVKLREKDRKLIMAGHSLGLTLSDNFEVKSVVPGSPADDAGLATNMELVGVNDLKFTADRFRSAIADSKENRQVALQLFEGDHFREITIQYDGGERYPSLGRYDDRPDLLKKICEPRGLSAR